MKNNIKLELLKWDYELDSLEKRTNLTLFTNDTSYTIDPSWQSVDDFLTSLGDFEWIDLSSYTYKYSRDSIYITTQDVRNFNVNQGLIIKATDQFTNEVLYYICNDKDIDTTKEDGSTTIYRYAFEFSISFNLLYKAGRILNMPELGEKEIYVNTMHAPILVKSLVNDHLIINYDESYYLVDNSHTSIAFVSEYVSDTDIIERWNDLAGMILGADMNELDFSAWRLGNIRNEPILNAGDSTNYPVNWNINEVFLQSDGAACFGPTSNGKLDRSKFIQNNALFVYWFIDDIHGFNHRGPKVPWWKSLTDGGSDTINEGKWVGVAHDYDKNTHYIQTRNSLSDMNDNTVFVVCDETVSQIDVLRAASNMSDNANNDCGPFNMSFVRSKFISKIPPWILMICNDEQKDDFLTTICRRTTPEEKGKPIKWGKLICDLKLWLPIIPVNRSVVIPTLIKSNDPLGTFTDWITLLNLANKYFDTETNKLTNDFEFPTLQDLVLEMTGKGCRMFLGNGRFENYFSADSLNWNNILTWDGDTFKISETAHLDLLFTMASTRRYDLVSHNIFRKEFISSDSPIGVSFTPDDDTLTTKNSAYEEWYSQNYDSERSEKEQAKIQALMQGISSTINDLTGGLSNLAQAKVMRGQGDSYMHYRSNYMAFGAGMTILKAFGDATSIPVSLAMNDVQYSIKIKQISEKLQRMGTHANLSNNTEGFLDLRYQHNYNNPLINKRYVIDEIWDIYWNSIFYRGIDINSYQPLKHLFCYSSMFFLKANLTNMVNDLKKYFGQSAYISNPDYLGVVLNAFDRGVVFLKNMDLKKILANHQDKFFDEKYVLINDLLPSSKIIYLNNFPNGDTVLGIPTYKEKIAQELQDTMKRHVFPDFEYSIDLTKITLNFETSKTYKGEITLRLIKRDALNLLTTTNTDLYVDYNPSIDAIECNSIDAYKELFYNDEFKKWIITNEIEVDVYKLDPQITFEGYFGDEPEEGVEDLGRPLEYKVTIKGDGYFVIKEFYIKLVDWDTITIPEWDSAAQNFISVSNVAYSYNNGTNIVEVLWSQCSDVLGSDFHYYIGYAFEMYCKNSYSRVDSGRAPNIKYAEDFDALSVSNPTKATITKTSDTTFDLVWRQNGRGIPKGHFKFQVSLI